MIERGGLVDVIDVCSKEDFSKGHVPGAVNLPKERWGSFYGLSRERANVVYCYSQQCYLTAKACKLFAENGYSVMELESGFDAWQNIRCLWAGNEHRSEIQITDLRTAGF
jgi:rhodanese-related sulfurtransferase